MKSSIQDKKIHITKICRGIKLNSSYNIKYNKAM